VAVISLVLQMTNLPLSVGQASEIGSQSEVFKQEALELEEQAATQETPPIILWNPQAATGMGGGGGNEPFYQEPPVVPESFLEGYGIGGGASEMEPTAWDEMANLDEELSTPESELAALDQATGMGGDEPPFIEPTPTMEIATPVPLVEAMPLVEAEEPSLERTTGESNPILGIAPQDERGDISIDETQGEQPIAIEPSSTAPTDTQKIGSFTIAAAILSVICAIIAVALRRKQR
jgi:hypothetical protein